VFLAAFVLYGVGASIGGWLGVVFVAANGAAVVGIGIVVARLLRASQPRLAGMYLLVRVVEALLLLVGMVVLATGGDQGVADLCYRAAMLFLGVVSVFTWPVVARVGAIPGWLGWWGAVGYTLLAVGVLVAFGSVFEMALLVPGGLFEVVLGVRLLAVGFKDSEAFKRRGDSP